MEPNPHVTPGVRPCATPQAVVPPQRNGGEKRLVPAALKSYGEGVCKIVNSSRMDYERLVLYSARNDLTRQTVACHTFTPQHSPHDNPPRGRSVAMSE